MRILIFTGSRAEWGLLKHLVHELDRYFEVYLLVSGQHLSPTYGHTCLEIDFDLLRTYKTEMLLDSDSSVGMAKSLFLGGLSYVEIINRSHPDLFICLGDRYETLAVALAAFTLGVPIGHIHGGELTLSSLDNGYRNAITQLASYHFAATGAYKRRIMQMIDYQPGDNNVWNVGALGLEDLPEPCWPKSKRLFLAYHPTNEKDGGLEILENILSCLDGYEVYITGANSDAHGRAINKRLREFARWSPSHTYFAMNYRRDDFLRLLNTCKAIIGNSSCGIIEAPSLGVITINVGNRQTGRERAPSVIDCPNGNIRDALCLAYKEDFEKIARRSMNPYGGKGAAKRIREQIQKLATSPNDSR